MLHGQHTGLWPSCHSFNKVLLLLLLHVRNMRLNVSESGSLTVIGMYNIHVATDNIFAKLTL